MVESLVKAGDCRKLELTCSSRSDISEFFLFFLFLSRVIFRASDVRNISPFSWVSLRRNCSTSTFLMNDFDLVRRLAVCFTRVCSSWAISSFPISAALLTSVAVLRFSRNLTSGCWLLRGLPVKIFVRSSASSYVSLKVYYYLRARPKRWLRLF